MAHTPDHLDGGASEARNEPPTRRFMNNLRPPVDEPPSRDQYKGPKQTVQPTNGFGSLMLGGPEHQMMERAERDNMKPGGDRAMANQVRAQIDSRSRRDG